MPWQTSRTAFRRCPRPPRVPAITPDAGGHIREGRYQVAQPADSGYRRAGDVVRHNPGRTVAAAFGAGLAVGVLVGWTLSIRSR